MYKMMTPGPSQVRENVLLARSRQFQNPDLDCDFVEYYHDTCKLYSSLLHTENESLILGGEGILGLEAACASLTEPGDRIQRFCLHLRWHTCSLHLRLLPSLRCE